MGMFLDTAFGFPTVLFTPLLVVVAVYWLLVSVGATGSDALDSVDDSGEAAGLSSLMSRVGLGRVPVTVALSSLVCVAWFVSMMGSIMTSLLHTTSTPLLIALGLVVLLIALVAAWAVTSGLVMSVQRFLPSRSSGSKNELVGRTCVIRIGEANEGFGQAEITTAGGAAISIPVRTTGGEVLPVGSTALIFDHSAEQDVFLVTYFDAALDPGQG
ncbi:OB-fold-containig protein [Nocardiopsis dassonvillei]|uniref:OB-fold-containig protein n=1 Tax=Nocardiopsis TaxID=2013 RepID=UPI00064C08EE|nr:MULTISPECIES: OB-fold-containig protein [Nocardiopsis]MCK9872165.1 YqiJ family protein [Nocardiopsis dassonvillei]